MEKTKNYRLKFIKYVKGEHVEYKIKLICMEDSKINVEFSDRYSNLKDLHETFKKEANSINFPKFPPKKYFGNTDEKFLNQRQTALEHYFNTILGSKEFSNIVSLRKWVESLIKKYDKNGSQEKDISQDNSIDKNDVKDETKKILHSNQSDDRKNKQSFSQNNDLIQRCKEVVDIYSKNFIDLGNDNNPHFEIEDGIAKEKNYKQLLKTTNVLDKTNSRFFKIPTGDNGRFDRLGQEELQIAKLEVRMLSKLNAITNLIKNEIPNEYIVEDIILNLNINRR